jgi:hypothetical protein
LQLCLINSFTNGLSRDLVRSTSTSMSLKSFN